MQPEGSCQENTTTTQKQSRVVFLEQLSNQMWESQVMDMIMQHHCVNNGDVLALVDGICLYKQDEDKKFERYCHEVGAAKAVKLSIPRDMMTQRGKSSSPFVLELCVVKMKQNMNIGNEDTMNISSIQHVEIPTCNNKDSQCTFDENSGIHSGMDCSIE